MGRRPYGRRGSGGVRAAMKTAALALGAAFLPLSIVSPASAEIPAATNKGDAWVVTQESWGPEHEKGYAEFVQAIGRSDCDSVSDCLADPANPYRDENDPLLFGDCADMAFVLRGYYAWKHGLPFAYQNAMRTADGSGEDLRYSSNGNVVAGKRIAHGATPVSAKKFLSGIGNEVSTAMFRTHPVKGGGKFYDDFYPVDITRDAVRPGSIAYDIYGHVGLVFDVLEDGRIMIVASHPDHTISRTVYGANFMRAKPELGAAIKAWRPITLKGAKRRADGSLAGGQIVAGKNEEIADFSLIQFFGNTKEPEGAPWSQGAFVFEDRTLSFYDYVRRKLAAPGFRYNPVDELAHGLDEICGAVRDRKTAVDIAVDYKVPLQPHPNIMPLNIYGTYGDWERFSTPSRDARLKVSFIELRRELQRLVDKVAANDPSVVYEGADLPGDLWKTFLAKKEQCGIVYRRSDDSRVRLNLAHIMDRLWDLSFDPFHCPERRWGAKDGQEFETCTDDALKTRWYEAQRYLRYQAERTYDVRMDFRLEQLKSPAEAKPEDGGIGAEAPADHDIRKYIVSLAPAPEALTAGYVEGAPKVYRVGQTMPADTWVPFWRAALKHADPGPNPLAEPEAKP